ncbi:MAG TPA: murein biosynthesis integral membrane protein MurJ [Phycisphaerales bacterium]|nr:murein biosynthesis integral membrane protein MurJ [Phycisphaerales bacterium]
MTGSVPPASGESSDRFVRHARTFASMTLVSRVFGLVRDALLARALGVGATGTAFNFAFQIPNTFRRLFGEGALSAAFIPEYAQQLKHDPATADRLASLVAGVMVVGLGALTLVLEGAILVALAVPVARESAGEALVLMAVMLPFMPLVCLTAALGGVLQTHGRFAPQAGAPVILNLCMIGAVLIGAHALAWTPERTALLVGASVVLAGVAQVLWCLRDLRGLVRWTRVVSGASGPARRMLKKMGPVVIGLGALQLSTLADSLIAGYPVFFGPALPGGTPYPLDEGAGAALTYAQRLYQFPLGVFGIALATAAFPLLAKQADDRPAFVRTLRRSVRLAALIGLPATLGLLAVAPDAVRVVYLGGRVDSAAAGRIAQCVLWYTPMIGAYSVTHVLTRAFYASGETALPTRVSLSFIGVNLALNLTLMFFFAERGLAMASSIAALGQLGVLAWLAHRRLGGGMEGVFDRPTLRGLGGSAVCAAAMLAIVAGAMALWPRGPEPGFWDSLLRLAAACALGAGVCAGLALLLLKDEVRWLLDRQQQANEPASPG